MENIYIFTNNILIDIATILIALLAIVLTIYEGKEIRKHNRLSTKPIFLFEETFLDNEVLYSLDIKNNGFGPGIILGISFYLTEDNLTLDQQGLKYYFENKFKNKYGLYIRQPQLFTDASIAEKDKISILSIRVDFMIFDDDEKTIKNILLFLSKLKLIIEYKSIYDITEKREYEINKDNR
jgi:hypothetical protein